MGILNVKKVFEKHAPNSTKRGIALNELANYKLAVDVPIYINKYLRTAGEDDWLKTFTKFIVLLRTSNVFPVFVFDGKAVPVEKKETQKERQQSSGKIKVKEIELRNYLNMILAKKDVVVPVSIIKKVNEIANTKLFEEKETHRDMFLTTLSERIEKLRRQTLYPTTEINNLAKEFISICGFTWIQSEGEAEKNCAELALNGTVDGVLSEDTDILVYGTEYFFHNLDLKDLKIDLIHFPTLIEELGFTKKQYRDFCIMCGCDYNSNIPRVGSM
jgi:flap endonuclease-1